MTAEQFSGLDLSAVVPYVKSVTPSVGATRVPTPDLALVSRPFVGSLTTTYVVDVDAGLRFVSQDELDGMALTVDELHEQAVRNLASYVSRQSLRTPEYHDIRPILLDGVFEVSVMFLDEPWSRFEAQFGEGSVLAVAPARDILACCATSSPAGRAQLSELIDRIWPNGDHLLTRDYYRRVDGVWQLD